MPQQIQNLSLKNLGSNVSLLGSINEFRVDIIESEFGGHGGNRGGGRAKAAAAADHDHTPSFLCERVYLQVSISLSNTVNYF